MTRMTTADARIIDPVLSTLLAGYENADYVGYALFPRVDVTLEGGKRIEFDKSCFERVNTRRAPGGGFARISLGYEGKPYVLENHGVQAIVPLEHAEDAAAGPGIDLISEGVYASQGAVDLELECQQAEIATSPASYGSQHSAPTNPWSTANGTPVDDVKAAREAVRARIGKRPNVMLLGAKAAEAAKSNPQVRSYFPNTDGPLTMDQLKQVFEVETLVIGDAVVVEGGTQRDIWPDVCILAYVAPAKGRSRRQPSYGYTYVKKGHPTVSPPRFDDDCNSWVCKVVQSRAPLLTGMDAGYLLHDLAPV